MAHKKKIIGIGTSLGVTVDKVIRNSLDIKKGDNVWVTFKKIKKGGL